MRTLFTGLGTVLGCLTILSLSGWISRDGRMNHHAGSGYWNRLADPVQICDGSEPINVTQGYAAPFVCDFNHDGLKDLLVGQFGGGKLRFYPNRGTNAQPMFRGFEYVQVNRKDITVPYG
jgi:hypothetical protein